MTDHSEAFREVIDPSTEWDLVPSGSPPSVDGYARNEQKFMRCRFCGAQTIIDKADETTTGIDELVHKPDCPQRTASVREPEAPGDAFDTIDD